MHFVCDRPSLSSYILHYLPVYIISCSIFRVFTVLMEHLKVINYFRRERERDRERKEHGLYSARGRAAGINENKNPGCKQLLPKHTISVTYTQDCHRQDGSSLIFVISKNSFASRLQNNSTQFQAKGKGFPVTCHAGREGEQSDSSTHS
jgi:hypothetical protein